MAFYGILAEDFGLQSISEIEIHQFDWKSELHCVVVSLLPGWLSNLIIFQGSATLQEHTEAHFFKSTVESQLKKGVYLQIYLHKTSISADRCLDSVHKYFSNQRTWWSLCTVTFRQKVDFHELCNCLPAFRCLVVNFSQKKIFLAQYLVCT